MAWMGRMNALGGTPGEAISGQAPRTSLRAAALLQSPTLPMDELILKMQLGTEALPDLFGCSGVTDEVNPELTSVIGR